MAVRWYLMFPVSYRDLEIMLQDCGVSVHHTMIFRWIQTYAAEQEKRIRPHLRMGNGSWRVDETYVKVKGRWTYLYRAVDSRGQTIDFLLSAKRDAAAAKRFFRKALTQPHTVNPRTITVDKNPADPKAIVEMKQAAELWRACRLRQVKYLNNIVEQDHRHVKRLTRPGLGFGSLWTARRALAGFGAIAMIRKGQVRNVGGDDTKVQATFIAGAIPTGHLNCGCCGPIMACRDLCNVTNRRTTREPLSRLCDRVCLLPVPRQQFMLILRGKVGNASEPISEPGARIDVIEPGGHDQRIQRRGPFSAAVSPSEQGVLSSEGHQGFILPISARMWLSITAGMRCMAVRSGCSTPNGGPAERLRSSSPNRA